MAAFGRAAGAVDQERGSRLRAVGVLTAEYIGLAAHIPFLRTRVRFALRNPGDYSELAPYYESTRSDWELPRETKGGGETIGAAEHHDAGGESPNSGSSSSSPVVGGELQVLPRPTVPQILQELPAGQLATFVDYFGPQVFLVGLSCFAVRRRFANNDLPHYRYGRMFWPKSEYCISPLRRCCL